MNPSVFCGKRIIILGCPGSGKTTFANKLHELTGIPLIHLDSIWWKADRTHISRDEFDKRLAMAISGPEWLTEGDYSRTYEVRIRACDVIVFLDFEEEECMKGITERIGKERDDMPWTEQSLDPELVQLVEDYHTKNRPVLLQLFEKYKDKQKLIFRSREQVNEWFKQWK